MKIIFWDIDGTLLGTAKAGLYAFREATEQIFGKRPIFKGITAAGMTDRYIASEIIFKTFGAKATENETTALITRYEQLLPQHLAANEGHTIEPVTDILAYLHDKPDYLSLLLTGNTVAGAQAKLKQFKLDHYFDFSLSAFGDTCWDRSGVAAQALSQVQAKYPGIKPSNLFVIGDTPNDIRCGKEIGAWTVAVATGTYSLEELESHSPWWLTKTLPAPLEFAQKLAATVR